MKKWFIFCNPHSRMHVLDHECEYIYSIQPFDILSNFLNAIYLRSLTMINKAVIVSRNIREIWENKSPTRHYKENQQLHKLHHF